MAQKLSVLLAQLSEKAKHLENEFAQSKAETQDKIHSWEENAKQKAAKSKAAFDAKKETLEVELKSNWETVKSNFDNGVSKVKDDFRQARHNIKAATAETRAEWAEDDAEMSVYFAMDAITDAEQAIIDAIKARQNANSY